MELKFWLVSCIVIYSSVLSEAKKPNSKKSKSNIKERLKAVENLVRSELFLVRENIEIGGVERELLREKLNETLEMLDMSKIETDRTERAKLVKNLNDTLELLDKKIERVVNNKFETDKVKREKLMRKLNKALKLLDMSEVDKKIETGKKEREKLWKILNDTLKLLDTSFVHTENMTQIQECGKVKESSIELLTMKIEKNGDIIEGLSEGLIRTKRGFMEEKKSRKGDFNALITYLSDIAQSQKEIIQNQNKIMESHENLAKDISALQTATDALKNKSEILEHKLGARGIELSSPGKLQVKSNNKTLGLTPDSCTCNTLNENLTETSLGKETVTPKEAQEWSVRLVSGRGPHEGRVELSYRGRHGTVCDSFWGDEDARVVCKMLGYIPTGAKAYRGPAALYHGHKFGEGTGEILLSHVNCLGDEDSLFSCKHRGIGVHSCNHGEDAGVKCRSSA